MPIQQQPPLEVNDFSGGKTDNFLMGGPTRYLDADNFLVTVDKKLELRPGSDLFDPINYVLPGNPGRINTLFTVFNETKLIAHRGQDLFYLKPDWTQLTGPTGNLCIPQAGTDTVLNY